MFVVAAIGSYALWFSTCEHLVALEEVIYDKNKGTASGQACITDDHGQINIACDVRRSSVLEGDIVRQLECSQKVEHRLHFVNESGFPHDDHEDRFAVPA